MFVIFWGICQRSRLPIVLGFKKLEFQGSWVNHAHHLHAKAARSIAGLQLQVGRILFPLDDGRLGDLHLLGLGGESSGPRNCITGTKDESKESEMTSVTGVVALITYGSRIQIFVKSCWCTMFRI
ncbi:hypothetical protein K1719_019096 [Acacia pycnantha]|nr:hypothetical protein K1719_026982 [Acacia pycnantha]KAI9110055.1 hypothetical protein K1719_019096 [Acacia pycnantha]